MKKLYSVALVSATMILFFILALSTASAAPFAYVANSGDKTVSVIDTETNTVKDSIPIGYDVDIIASSLIENNVYVVGIESGPEATHKTYFIVIDTLTNNVTKSIFLGDVVSGGVAASPIEKKVYLTWAYKHTVDDIDLSTGNVSPIKLEDFPSEVVFAPDGTKIYVTTDKSFLMINTATDTVISTLSLNWSPTGLAVSPDGKSVYLSNFDENKIYVIDSATNTISSNIEVGNGPASIAVTPDGNKLYVVNQEDDTVSVIDTYKKTVTATVHVSSKPWDVVVTQDGNKVYVTNFGNLINPGNTVSVIDTNTNNVSATVEVGNNPCGIVVKGVKEVTTENVPQTTSPQKTPAGFNCLIIASMIILCIKKRSV